MNNRQIYGIQMAEKTNYDNKVKYKNTTL